MFKGTSYKMKGSHAAPMVHDNTMGSCYILAIINQIFNSVSISKAISEYFLKHDTLYSRIDVLKQEGIRELFKYWIHEPLSEMKFDQSDRAYKDDDRNIYSTYEEAVSSRKEFEINKNCIMPVLLGRIMYFAYMYPHTNKNYNDNYYGIFFENKYYARDNSFLHKNAYSFVLGNLISVYYYFVMSISSDEKINYSRIKRCIEEGREYDDAIRLFPDAKQRLMPFDICIHSTLNKAGIIREIYGGFIGVLKNNIIRKFSSNINDVFVYIDRPIYRSLFIKNEDIKSLLIKLAYTVTLKHDSKTDKYYLIYCSDIMLESPEHATYYDILNNIHNDNGNRSFLPIELLIDYSGTGAKSIYNMLDKYTSIPNDFILTKERFTNYVPEILHFQQIEIENDPSIGLIIPDTFAILVDKSITELPSSITAFMQNRGRIFYLNDRNAYRELDNYMAVILPSYNMIGTYANKAAEFALFLMKNSASKIDDGSFLKKRYEKNVAQLESSIKSPYSKLISYRTLSNYERNKAKGHLGYNKLMPLPRISISNHYGYVLRIINSNYLILLSDANDDIEFIKTDTPVKETIDLLMSRVRLDMPNTNYVDFHIKANVDRPIDLYLAFEEKDLISPVVKRISSNEYYTIVINHRGDSITEESITLALRQSNIEVDSITEFHEHPSLVELFSQ